MKCNYAVYDEKIYEIPAEVDSQIVEQMIIEQARCSMEQNKHEVIRPTQKVGKDVLLLMLYFCIPVVILFIARIFTGMSLKAFISVSVICMTAYILILFKKIMLTLIIIYQKYAPENIRASCLYEPCCSEYMRISIMKYGAYKGFINGIKRILRCHYPNGGIDEP